MPRPTDCIFCGKPTGSREHTFPAALGGRRMNKGILCGDCNKGFSTLDTALSGQLTFINGMIGVRPDHQDEPRKARIVDPTTGNVLTVDGTGTVSQAAPKVIANEVIDGKGRMTVTVANERQYQDWLKEMRAKGLHVQKVERSTHRRFTTKGLPVELSFGGIEPFREVGRIALNFLAHHRPELARHPGLRTFKDYAQGKIAGPFVWYDYEWADADLPENKFPFGHRILIGLDAASGEACARLSFFSTFELAVRFGGVASEETTTILIDIDPQAEHPPDDIIVRELAEHAVGRVIEKPAGDHVEVLSRRVDVLLSRVRDAHWRHASTELLPALNAMAALPAGDRFEQVHEVLGEHRQRILNHITYCAEQLKPLLEANEETKAFAHIFDHFVETNEEDSSGLSMQARCTIELVRSMLAERIATELAKGVMDDWTLRLLLEGTEGAAIAGAVMKDLIEGAFERATRY